MIFTDHKNLAYLRTAKHLRPQQARWSLFPDVSEATEPDAILSVQNFLLIQPDLKSAIKQAYSQGTEPGVSSLTKQEDLLWFQDKIFIPQQVRLQVLRTFHEHKLAEHFGVQETSELLQRSFWWPGWRQDCKDYVSSCTVCQHNNRSKAKSWGLLRPLPIPEQPWRKISMNFIVDLPPSEGFTTILVVVDRLSKTAHFVSMVDTPSAVDTANTFIKEIVRLHGIPDSIVYDRGVQFTSRFWKDLCKSLAIEVCLSSAYHPQSNGQTGRTNQTLEHTCGVFVPALKTTGLLFFLVWSLPTTPCCMPPLIKLLFLG